MKRLDYITWDNFFMKCAETAALRSKDPNTRHGSVIVHDNKIISTGYNGLVNGLSDDGYHLDQMNGDTPITFLPKDGYVYDYWLPENKENFVVHSELNAILNASASLKGSILYLYSEKNYLPCKECAKAIAQSGIIEVVVKGIMQENSVKYNWDITRHIFKRNGINVRILENS